MTYNRRSMTASIRLDREALFILKWDAGLRGAHWTTEVREYLEKRAEAIQAEHPELVIPDDIRVQPAATPAQADEALAADTVPDTPPPDTPVDPDDFTEPDPPPPADQVHPPPTEPYPEDPPGFTPDVTQDVGPVDVEEPSVPEAVRAFCEKIVVTLGGSVTVTELLDDATLGDDGLVRVTVNGVPFTSEPSDQEF